MSQQIQITGGAKVRNLEGVLTGTAGVVNALGINVANGIPKLDSSGKILVAQLPNSVMEYKGTWNASTNTPTLANGTGNQGDVYLCSTAGTVNFGAGAITFAVGDQVIYSGTIWQKAGGSTGTVTSVAVTESGDALTITGSPITTSGTINIGFAGTSGQYVNGAGGLTTFPTLLSSVGLSMPSAFTVTNSPLTANGTISVTGAGTTAQYIRGDGSLATFPSTSQEAKRLITEVYNSTGATLTKGTIVYINGGQGNLPTITKAIATGDATSAQTYGVVQTDITNNNNGFVVVIGSLNDIDTQSYTAGTQLYLSGTTAGAWTSTKPSAPIHLVYVGIVVRSHPTQGVIEVRIQNGYELDELHDVAITSVANTDGIFYNSSNDLWENKTIAEVLGFTPQAQLNGTGFVKASGTTISYDNSTYLTTSAAASTYVPYTGATNNVNLGENDLSVRSINNKQLIKLEGYVSGASTLAGALAIKTSTSGFTYGGTGYISISSNDTNALTIINGSGLWSKISFNSISANRTFTLPNASGTIALTTDLGAYLPLSGGTLTGDLTLNNGSADGGQLVLASSGYSNWNIDNFSGRFRAYYGSTEYFTINASGNVGINSTDPLSKLQVVGTGTVVRFGEASGTTGKQLLFGINASTGTSEIQSVWQGTANTILALNPAGGNVAIGASTAASKLTITGSDSGTAPTYLAINNTASGVGVGGGLQIQSNGTSVASLDWVYDGSVFNSSLSAFGNLLFKTNGSTVRMQINSGGGVDIKNLGTGSTGVGVSSPNSYGGIHFNASSLATASTGWYHFVGQSGNGSSITTNNILIYGNGNVANANNVYSAISDIKLKENIVDTTPKLDKLMQVRVVNYNLIGDELNQIGVVAQELEQIFPGLVDENIDIDAEGNQLETTTKSVKYSVFVPMLIKAIQEQQAQIEDLKALINK